MAGCAASDGVARDERVAGAQTEIRISSRWDDGAGEVRVFIALAASIWSPRFSVPAPAHTGEAAAAAHGWVASECPSFSCFWQQSLRAVAGRARPRGGAAVAASWGRSRRLGEVRPGDRFRSGERQRQRQGVGGCTWRVLPVIYCSLRSSLFSASVDGGAVTAGGSDVVAAR